MLSIKRNKITSIKAWYRDKRRKPLVVRGARQVGKTNLVEMFAKDEGIELFVLNLEQHKELTTVFQSLKPEVLLQELSLLFGVTRAAFEKGLLFLDEIQAIPEAITMLRYLYEKYSSIPVIAAGSLLEFALSSTAFSMPVGRIEYLFLGPITFKEFLYVSDEAKLIGYLEEYSLKDTMSPIVHTKLTELYRLYLFIGGMPEVMSEYLESRDMKRVGKVKSSLLSTYRDDFAKYTKSVDLVRIRKVFEYIPTAIGEKVIFSKIDSNSRAGDLKRCLDLLTMAQVVTRAYHSTCSGIPMNAQKDSDIFKSYFLDCGLVTYASGIQTGNLEKMITTRFITEGSLAEQFVAQHLQFQRLPYEEPSLFYWLREGKGNNAEVDFVFEHNSQIIPIEIKAGTSGSLKSLHQFIDKTGEKLALRFDLNLPTKQRVSHRVASSGNQIDFNLFSLPLYCIEEWQRLVDEGK